MKPVTSKRRRHCAWTIAAAVIIAGAGRGHAVRHGKAGLASRDMRDGEKAGKGLRSREWRKSLKWRRLGRVGAGRSGQGDS